MSIKSVRMSKDPNNKWELQVMVDELPNIKMSEIACIEDSHYIYGENEDGFVKFGVFYDVPTFRQEPGYVWSSRCGVFNTIFGKRLIEVTTCIDNGYGSIIRYGSFSITIDKALELLPDGFHISLFQYDDGEEFYDFIRYDEKEEDYIADYSGEFICPIFA